MHALSGIDMELYPGKFVVVLGPSGSGESTLPNILDGLDHISESRRYGRDDRQLTEFRSDSSIEPREE